MALATILATVGANLPTGTLWFFGEELVGSNALKSNSVVWAPGNESFTPARQGRGAKSIRTRAIGMTAYLWAVGDGTQLGDMEACEALINAVVVALERTCPGSYDVTGGQWGVRGPTNKGRTYALALTFEVPVLMPERTVTVAAVQQETALALSTGDVSGVPAP
jgi:hypothetical protein